MGSCFTSTHSAVAPETPASSMTPVEDRRRSSAGKKRTPSTGCAVDYKRSPESETSTVSYNDSRALKMPDTAAARTSENTCRAMHVHPLTSRDIEMNDAQAKRSPTWSMDWNNTHSSGFESLSNQQREGSDDIPDLPTSSPGHRQSTGPRVGPNQSSLYDNWSSISWRSQSSSSKWSDSDLGLDLESIRTDNSPRPMSRAASKRPKAAIKGRRTNHDLTVVSF